MVALRWAMGSAVVSVSLALALALPIAPVAQIEFPTPTPTPAFTPTPTPTPIPTMPSHPELAGERGGFVAFFSLLIVYSAFVGAGVLPAVAVLVGLAAGLGYSSVWLGWLAAIAHTVRKFWRGS
jgi:hypothetical protein